MFIALHLTKCRKRQKASEAEICTLNCYHSSEILHILILIVNLERKSSVKFFFNNICTNGTRLCCYEWSQPIECWPSSYVPSRHLHGIELNPMARVCCSPVIRVKWSIMPSIKCRGRDYFIVGSFLHLSEYNYYIEVYCYSKYRYGPPALKLHNKGCTTLQQFRNCPSSATKSRDVLSWHATNNGLTWFFHNTGGTVVLVQATTVQKCREWHAVMQAYT